MRKKLTALHILKEDRSIFIAGSFRVLARGDYPANDASFNVRCIFPGGAKDRLPSCFRAALDRTHAGTLVFLIIHSIHNFTVT